ncbi:hypothetical protein G7078_06285 [Sphingomonas sinipercae]|uniref:Uncharacterized protein n=1 Tax=Sphingomonas sinipercae TaxID=2714944 RepID=A0A6G7ZNF6_9SPHN|nr:hypothetical protein [Sphingomonas sinipercae]QIL02436.1 hypothetical protein G7078_06285 [Sphingomonas sinipercae]
MRPKADRTLSALIALVLAGAAAPTAGAQSKANPWEKHETAALAEGRGCYASNDVSACKRMLAAYALALKSPGLGEQARERFVAAMLDVYASAAKTSRKKGDANGALMLLGDGQKLMVDHYAGGSHWHILFDTSDLLVEKVATLWELGHGKEMAAALDDVRGAQDTIFKGITDQPCSEDQQNARMYMVQQAANFEWRLGRFANDASSEAGENVSTEAIDLLVQLGTDAQERMTRWNVAAPSRVAPVVPDICKYLGVAKK